MERRLSAILAVDVVGYSRLMERDEADTFERLRAHRKDLFEPEIAGHHGRIFKLTGDGLLAEFGSVVDAVECAVLLQREMAERNNGLPVERRIDVRMGLHVGDVIIEGEDRHGDAVNIAARLQQIAETGGICVSGAVVDHVRRKVALRFEARGEERLKNIAEPVAVYRVGVGGAPRRTGASRRLAIWASAAAALLLLVGAGVVATALYGIPAVNALRPIASDQGIPVIVVRPFRDLTGSQSADSGMDLEKVGEGIAEELITDLSAFPEYNVLSSTSSFAYAGKTVPEIVEATGATFIIEGSIRRISGNALVTTQLISGTTDMHLKSFQIEEQFADSVLLQKGAVQKIRDQLGGMSGVFRDELNRIAESKAESDLTEFDYYLLGHVHMFRGKEAEVRRADEIWKRGLARFPNSILLRCKISFSTGWSGANLEEAHRFVDEAAAGKRKSLLDEWYVHYAQAVAAAREYDRKRAAVEAHKVLEMAPYDTMAHVDMSWVLVTAGRYDEAVEAATYGITHDPTPRWWYFENLEQSYQEARRMQELVELAETEVKKNPKYEKWWYQVLARAYAATNQIDKSRAIWKTIDSLPDPPEP